MEANAIMLVAGVLFLVIAVVGGGFTLERLQVPPVPNWSRIASAALGMLFVGAFFYVSLSEEAPVVTQATTHGDSPGTDQAPPSGAATTAGLAVLRDFTGPDQTADGVELTEFRVSSPTATPVVGDTIMVEFSLRNASQAPISFEFTFVGARSPDDENEDFGEDNQGEQLQPGATVSMEQFLVVDQPGPWTLWPCYELPEGDCPDRWNAFSFNVAG